PGPRKKISRMLGAPGSICRFARRGTSSGWKRDGTDTAAHGTTVRGRLRPLHERERARQKHLPREAALDLAAGRLGQAACADQDDFTGGNFMFPRNRFADRGDDLFDGDLPPERTLDFLHQDQLILVVMVGYAEGGATMAAQ